MDVAATCTTRLSCRRKDANPSYLVVYGGRGKYRGVKFVVRMARPPGKGIHNVSWTVAIMYIQ